VFVTFTFVLLAGDEGEKEEDKDFSSAEAEDSFSTAPAEKGITDGGVCGGTGEEPRAVEHSATGEGGGLSSRGDCGGEESRGIPLCRASELFRLSANAGSGRLNGCSLGGSVFLPGSAECLDCGGSFSSGKVSGFSSQSGVPGRSSESSPGVSGIIVSLA